MICQSLLCVDKWDTSNSTEEGVSVWRRYLHEGSLKSNEIAKLYTLYSLWGTIRKVPDKHL